MSPELKSIAQLESELSLISRELRLFVSAERQGSMTSGRAQRLFTWTNDNRLRLALLSVMYSKNCTLDEMAPKITHRRIFEQLVRDASAPESYFTNLRSEIVEAREEVMTLSQEFEASESSGERDRPVPFAPMRRNLIEQAALSQLDAELGQAAERLGAERPSDGARRTRILALMSQIVSVRVRLSKFYGANELPQNDSTIANVRDDISSAKADGNSHDDLKAAKLLAYSLLVEESNLS